MPHEPSPPSIAPVLPAPLCPVPRLEQLLPVLAEAGQRLLSAQPSHARHDARLMRQCVDQASASTLHLITETLARHWPEVPVLPAGLTPDRLPALQGPYWLCDPLDGAIQYLAGLPLWSINLTLMQGAEPQLAIVHDAGHGRSFHALRGQGAGCDGAAIRCNEAAQRALATVGTSFPNVPPRPQMEVEAFLGMLGRTVPAVLAQRWIGSAALSLAFVACGKLDAYWECGRHLVDWLPGLLIAREAGATVSALGAAPLGDPGSGILAAPAALHGQLLDLWQAGVPG